MNMCSRWEPRPTDHDEVVFEGDDCPMCVLLSTIEDREEDIIDLEDDVFELRKELEEATAEDPE